MKKLVLPIILIGLTAACIPENLKNEMDTQVVKAQHMLADQEFKKAISHIELHKLRNGSYPNTLSELQFLTLMDSSIFSRVVYTRLDSGYELNFNFEVATLEGNKSGAQLHYPVEFWEGLGCVKSNVK